MRTLIGILLMMVGSAHAERVALVIGNSTYAPDRAADARPNLANPGNDAGLIAKTLEQAGFQVTAKTNLDKDQMEAAVRAFYSSLKEGDTALFYYAGHGAQSGGVNYLVPVGVPLDMAEFEAAQKCYEAQMVLTAMEFQKTALNVVVLDCCRDNPFTRSWRSLEEGKAGMAQMAAPQETLIAYATAPGKVAMDGRGANSPYSAALAEEMLKPGVKIQEVFVNVARKVNAATGGSQRPWTATDLLGTHYFVPGSGGLRPSEPAVMEPKTDPFAGTFAGQSWENAKGTAFRWCPPGEFWMGSSEAEKKAFARDGVTTDDETRHKVKLTRGFWLSQNEVTQGEWEGVMGTGLVDLARSALMDDTLHTINGKKTTLRDFHGRTKDSDPMGLVFIESPSICMYLMSWDEAVEYCRKLTERERSAGKIPVGWRYALPTEAQWEYACRAGTETTLYNGEMSIRGQKSAPALDSIAWYGGNSSEGYSGRGTDTTNWVEKQYPGGSAGPRRVGQKKANAWGLCDMIGNVYEWCSDWYATDISSSVTDPTGPATGVYRVNRGGSWSDFAAYCRAANRCNLEPGNRLNNLGFRPALVPSNP